MNKYDENKVLRSVARVARVEGNHVILKSDAIVGIHMWGKLDYLVNYKGYTVSRSNSVITVKNERLLIKLISELRIMANYIVKTVNK